MSESPTGSLQLSLLKRQDYVECDQATDDIKNK